MECTIRSFDRNLKLNTDESVRPATGPVVVTAGSVNKIDNAGSAARLGQRPVKCRRSAKNTPAAST